MSGLYEDIDEDLDEMDDEDVDEARKRNRPNVRGRGYNQPRLEKSAVTQAQLQAAMSRVGEDVRKLAVSQKGVDGSVSRLRRDQQQFAQMSLMMPLLVRPKVVVLPTGQRVLSGEQDTMSMLLPFMMLGGMGGSGGGMMGGGNDMMMMMVMMMALSPPSTGTAVP
jgi:hypothetical protein